MCTRGSRLVTNTAGGKHARLLADDLRVFTLLTVTSVTLIKKTVPQEVQHPFSAHMRHPLPAARFLTRACHSYTKGPPLAHQKPRRGLSFRARYHQGLQMTYRHSGPGRPCGCAGIYNQGESGELSVEQVSPPVRGSRAVSRRTDLL